MFSIKKVCVVLEHISTITDSCSIFLPFRHETDRDFETGCRCGKSKDSVHTFKVGSDLEETHHDIFENEKKSARRVEAVCSH